MLTPSVVRARRKGRASGSLTLALRLLRRAERLEPAVEQQVVDDLERARDHERGAA